jgi:hypothetical protein
MAGNLRLLTRSFATQTERSSVITLPARPGNTLTGAKSPGKAIAKVDSPQADSIPWLLVTATGHSGNGAFTRVNTIQRIHTQGGQPPAAADCNPSKQNNEAKSAYTADYYFYAPTR